LRHATGREKARFGVARTSFARRAMKCFHAKFLEFRGE